MRARLGRDLVLLLEVLHDLSRPVEILASARAALAPGGEVLVADGGFFRLYELTR